MTRVWSGWHGSEKFNTVPIRLTRFRNLGLQPYFTRSSKKNALESKCFLGTYLFWNRNKAFWIRKEHIWASCPEAKGNPRAHIAKVKIPCDRSRWDLQYCSHEIKLLQIVSFDVFTCRCSTLQIWLYPDVHIYHVHQNWFVHESQSCRARAADDF